MDWTHLKALACKAGASPDFAACLEAFPVLELAKATPQDPRYHAEGDVWTHTRMVLEALVAQPYYSQADETERQVLFFAALLHDVAKYRTTQVDPATGAIRQPGHSRKGALEARLLLWQAGVPFEQREAICRLIAAHQVPLHAMEDSRSNRGPEYLVRSLSWQVKLSTLAALAEADMHGRICGDVRRVFDNIELFRELAKEEGCLTEPRVFADDHTRISYFRGASVHPDYALYQGPGSQVILMSGLPASGKNTWVETHYAGMPVVSFDDAREELGLKAGPTAGAAAHLVVERAKALLRAHKPFVWNATNINPQLRKKALDLLYDYNAQVTIVYLEASEREIKTRNHKRDTTLTNAGIEKMLLRWEVPLPTEAHCVQYPGANG